MPIFSERVCTLVHAKRGMHVSACEARYEVVPKVRPSGDHKGALPP